MSEPHQFQRHAQAPVARCVVRVTKGQSRMPGAVQVRRGGIPVPRRGLHLRGIAVTIAIRERDVFELDAAALEPGFWKVRIHWKLHQQDYFVDKRVVVKRGV